MHTPNSKFQKPNSKRRIIMEKKKECKDNSLPIFALMYFITTAIMIAFTTIITINLDNVRSDSYFDIEQHKAKKMNERWHIIEQHDSLIIEELIQIHKILDKYFSSEEIQTIADSIVQHKADSLYNDLELAV